MICLKSDLSGARGSFTQFCMSGQFSIVGSGRGLNYHPTILASVACDLAAGRGDLFEVITFLAVYLVALWTITLKFLWCDP